MPNDTSPDLKRGTAGRFLPGSAPGPGRPKGSRSKLGEVFVNAILADFQQHGVVAIETVRATDPTAYVKVIASLLPKEITAEDGEALFSGIQVTFVKSTPT